MLAQKLGVLCGQRGVFANRAPPDRVAGYCGQIELPIAPRWNEMKPASTSLMAPVWGLQVEHARLVHDDCPGTGAPAAVLKSAARTALCRLRQGLLLYPIC